MVRLSYGTAVLLCALSAATAIKGHDPLLLRVELSAEDAKALKHGGRRLKEAWTGQTVEDLPSVTDVAEHLLDAVFGFKAAKRLANQGLAGEPEPADTERVLRVEQLLRRSAGEASALAQMAAATQADSQGPGRYWWQRDGAPHRALPLVSDLLAARNGNSGPEDSVFAQVADNARLQMNARTEANKATKVPHDVALEQASHDLLSKHVLQKPNIWANEAVRRWWDPSEAPVDHVAALKKSTSHVAQSADTAEHRRMDLADAQPKAQTAQQHGKEGTAAASQTQGTPSDQNTNPNSIRNVMLEAAGVAAEDPFYSKPFLYPYPAAQTRNLQNPLTALEARNAVQQDRAQQRSTADASFPSHKLFGALPGDLLGSAHMQKAHAAAKSTAAPSGINRVHDATDEALMAVEEDEVLMFGGDVRLATAAEAARTAAAAADVMVPPAGTFTGVRTGLVKRGETVPRKHVEMNEVEFLKLKHSESGGYDDLYDPDYYFADTAEGDKQGHTGVDDGILAYEHFPDALALLEHKAAVVSKGSKGPSQGARDISDALAAELLDDSHEGFDSFPSTFLAGSKHKAAGELLKVKSQAVNSGSVWWNMLHGGQGTMETTRSAMTDQEAPSFEEWLTLLDVSLEWCGDNVVVELLIDADAIKAAHAIIDLEQELISDADGNPLVSLSLSVYDTDTGIPQTLLALLGGTPWSPLKLTLNDVEVLSGDLNSKFEAMDVSEGQPGVAPGLAQLSQWFPSFLRGGNAAYSAGAVRGSDDVLDRELVTLDRQTDSTVDEDGLIVTLTHMVVEDRVWVSNQARLLMLAAAMLLAVISLSMAFLGLRDLYAPQPVRDEEQTCQQVPQGPSGGFEPRQCAWGSIVSVLSFLPQSEERKALEEPLLCKEGDKC